MRRMFLIFFVLLLSGCAESTDSDYKSDYDTGYTDAQEDFEERLTELELANDELRSELENQQELINDIDNALFEQLDRIGQIEETAIFEDY